MLRRVKNKKKNGQMFTEYTIILGVIVMVLIAMNPMIKRGIQAMIKTVADEVGVQVNAEQKFDESGHLELSTAQVYSATSKRIQEGAGDTTYIFDDSVDSTTLTVTNLGFTEEQ